MDKLKDLLLSLLNFIGESKFRLFAVIILTVIGFGGWIIYSEKDAFMASYRAQQALPKMNGKYEEAINFVMKNSDAVMVAVFEVNTLSNSRKMVWLSTRKGGREKKYDDFNVGLFTKNQANNADVIELMAGKVACSDYTKPQSFIGFIYRDYGTTFMCRISVPAEPGVFIGQISVGWKDRPESTEDIVTVMQVASSILYKK